MAPRTFGGNNAWYERTREMQAAEPVEDAASIAPDEVEAHEAPLEWTITYQVQEEPLRSGAHLSVEIPLYFRLDHGRPYPVGTTHVKHVADADPGYAAGVDVSTPSDNVTLAFTISNCSRFSVLDVEVAEGAVQVGEPVTITLGEREGSRLRAPSFSQRFRFATGVQRRADDGYRPVSAEPVVDVHGADADELRLVAPSTPDPESDVEIEVIPADRYNRNPASRYDGSVSLEAPSFVDTAERFDFDGSDERVSVRPRDAVLDDTYAVPAAVGEGAGRITAIDRDNALLGRSNPIATDWSDRNVYWGDIHCQGYDSIGVGSPQEMFEWARNAAALDFAATANHYGGRYDVTPDVWERLVDAANDYDDPGAFVALVSYEWSGEYGHRNVYYRDGTGAFFGKGGSSSHYPTPRTTEALWDRLDAYDGDVMAFGHHPKYCGRSSWDRFHDDYQRLIEIYSAWGDSEVGGPWSVRSGLRKGHRVGFTGGTDTHKGQPSSGTHEYGKGSGITAVYAPELGREAIFDALYERRTYATTGPRILLDVECNGLPLGAERTATESDFEDRALAVRAMGTDDITSVDIIRNGVEVASFEPGTKNVRLDWTDDDPLDDVLRATDHPDGRDSTFYYVRLTQDDGHRAWASPVWFLD